MHTPIRQFINTLIITFLQAYNFYGRDDPSVKIPSCLEPSHIGSDVPSSIINPSPPHRPQKKTVKKKTKSRKPKRDQGDSDDGGGGEERNGEYVLLSMIVHVYVEVCRNLLC